MEYQPCNQQLAEAEIRRNREIELTRDQRQQDAERDQECRRLIRRDRLEIERREVRVTAAGPRTAR